jgi:hypothetical protein
MIILQFSLFVIFLFYFEILLNLKWKLVTEIHANIGLKKVSLRCWFHILNKWWVA